MYLHNHLRPPEAGGPNSTGRLTPPSRQPYNQPQLDVVVAGLKCRSVAAFEVSTDGAFI